MIYTIRHGGETIVESVGLMQLVYLFRLTNRELKTIVNLEIGQSLYLSDLRVNIFRIENDEYKGLYTSPLKLPGKPNAK